MGERLLCKQEVIGSSPFTSTTLRPAGFGWQATRKRILGEGVSPEALVMASGFGEEFPHHPVGGLGIGERIVVALARNDDQPGVWNTVGEDVCRVPMGDVGGFR